MLNKTNTALDQNRNKRFPKNSVSSNPLRLTTNQRMVYGALLNLERSAGAYELLDILKKKGINAAATVYRALNELKDKGLVQRIVSTRTFIALKKPHANNKDSILLICQKCGEVSSISDNKIGTVVDSSIKEIGYRISTYHLELMVLCSSCAGSGK